MLKSRPGNWIFWRVSWRPGRKILTDGQIRQGPSAMVQLLEHYFSEQGAGQARHRLMRRRSQNEQRSWRYLDIINRMIDKPGSRSHRVILLGLFLHAVTGERDAAVT